MDLSTKCLMSVFKTIQTLGTQGIPIRKHNAENDNLKNVLALKIDGDSDMQNWYKSRKTTWMSPDIQNEIIEMFGKETLQKVVERIKLSQYFGIIADETCDSSAIEQLSVCFRHVDQNFTIYEDFVGLYSLDACNAEFIYKVLMDITVRLELPMDQCRGQCYDGAATMSGVKTGVATRTSLVEPRALPTHCHMHSLNLSVQETVAAIPFIRDFMSLFQDLVVFIRDSQKRMAEIKKLAEDHGCALTSVRPLCPTKMTVKFDAISGFDSQAEVVSDFLDDLQISGNTTMIRSKADLDFQSRSTHSNFGLHYWFAKSYLRKLIV